MSLSENSKRIVDSSALAAAGLGVPGSFVPFLDTFGMAAIWIRMIIQLGKESGHKVNQIFLAKFIVGVLTASTFYLVGSELLEKLMMLSFIGAAGVVLINPVLNWLYTQRLGMILGDIFSQPDFSTDTLKPLAATIAKTIFRIPVEVELMEGFAIVSSARGKPVLAGDSLLKLSANQGQTNITENQFEPVEVQQDEQVETAFLLTTPEEEILSIESS